MPQTVFEKLERRLTEAGVPFEVLRHEPVFTSEEAAQVRGTPLSSGAKALICKADEQFVMFVLPADRRLDSKLTRKHCGIKSLRFATREEVEQISGLAPGSIPPFGSLFELPTWCDSALAEQPQINFNAGDHSLSICLAYLDYLAAELPRLATISATP